jgi:hypothetical protein
MCQLSTVNECYSPTRCIFSIHSFFWKYNSPSVFPRFWKPIYALRSLYHFADTVTKDYAKIHKTNKLLCKTEKTHTHIHTTFQYIPPAGISAWDAENLAALHSKETIFRTWILCAGTNKRKLHLKSVSVHTILRLESRDLESPPK